MDDQAFDTLGFRQLLFVFIDFFLYLFKIFFDVWARNVSNAGSWFRTPEWPHRCSIQKRAQPTRGPTECDQHGVPNDLSDVGWKTLLTRGPKRPFRYLLLTAG